ncbi:Plasma membrane t-SNARE, secretory vesicle fusion [Quaeritorhiza haematococci]|nr:Plasma membrane t-SNARE, secretory vesicle fusion [Quaeritorhiza haematococci]
MARDRLQELQQPSSTTLGRPSSVEMTTLPSAEAAVNSVIAEVDRINQTMQNIRKGMQELSQLYSQALIEISSDQSQYMQREADQIMAEIDILITDARRSIRAIAPTSSSSPVTRMGADERKVRFEQQKSLAKKLMEIATDYRTLYEDYKSKRRRQAQEQYRVVHPSATQEEIEHALSTTDGGNFFQQEMLSSRIGQQQKLEEVQSRHEELVKIEKSIKELVSLYDDMQMLLETQQKQLEAVEGYVDETNSDLEGGAIYLDDALEHRKKLCRTAWILCGIITLLVVIVLVIVLVKFILPAVRDRQGSGGGGATTTTTTSNAVVSSEVGGGVTGLTPTG